MTTYLFLMEKTIYDFTFASYNSSSQCDSFAANEQTIIDSIQYIGAIDKIYAEYTGDLSAGITINASKDIQVFAKRKNGETTKLNQDLSFTPNEIKLEKDNREVIEITYGAFSCEYELICSDRTVTGFSAEYTGKKEAGEELKTGSSNIKVEISYKDGTKETVTDWTMDQSVTLEADKIAGITIRYKDKVCSLKVTCSTMSDATYKTICESISYTELARNPQKYEGRNVKFTGEVIQVLEENSYGTIYVTLRVNTKIEYSMYYDDTVYVTYEMEDDSPHILEDDIITFYGEYTGLFTYESILGGSITIPKVDARIVDIK